MTRRILCALAGAALAVAGLAPFAPPLDRSSELTAVACGDRWRDPC